jgi:hypothetical protein
MQDYNVGSSFPIPSRSTFLRLSELYHTNSNRKRNFLNSEPNLFWYARVNTHPKK